MAQRVAEARSHLSAIKEHGFASPDPVSTIEEAFTGLEAAVEFLQSAVRPPEERRFPEADLTVNLGPTVAARVILASRDGKGWTIQEFVRLIAFLELQRSFLTDAPLNVSVHFGTPKTAPKD